jgi:hypothetical protein
VSTKTKMDTTPTGRRRNRSLPAALKREIVVASFARVGIGTKWWYCRGCVIEIKPTRLGLALRVHEVESRNLQPRR